MINTYTFIKNSKVKRLSRRERERECVCVCVCVLGGKIGVWVAVTVDAGEEADQMF